MKKNGCEILINTLAYSFTASRTKIKGYKIVKNALGYFFAASDIKKKVLK